MQAKLAFYDSRVLPLCTLSGVFSKQCKVHHCPCRPVEHPTVTPVAGSGAAEAPAVTPAEDSEREARLTVTPVADPEKDSLTPETLPFYAETGSLRAPGILQVALKKGTVVPMAITTGPEIMLQPENKEVAKGKFADSFDRAIEEGYLEG